MKILALEKENKNADWTNAESILKSEAVHDQYLDDVLREICFNENGEAVIILECESIEEAQKMLNGFP